MKLPFTGGGVCGTVRYEVAAAPLMMFKCHCHDCQHVTGHRAAVGQGCEMI